MVLVDVVEVFGHRAADKEAVVVYELVQNREDWSRVTLEFLEP